MRQFHHLGLPTDKKQRGEVYVESTKVWVTDPLKHPQRIEYLRYEADSPVKGPLRELPHFAFKTDNYKRDIRGQKVILGPFEAMPGMHVVFIEKDGAVFEFMQWDDAGRTTFTKTAKKTKKKAKKKTAKKR